MQIILNKKNGHEKYETGPWDKVSGRAGRQAYNAVARMVGECFSEEVTFE